MNQHEIYAINGPVVKVNDITDFHVMEMVYVGSKKLLGEVITVNNKETTIQVYESTSGLKRGEPVIPTGSPISVQLGPGIIKNTFDGIQRPLRMIADEEGAYIRPGSDVASLDKEKEWDVTFTVKEGDDVSFGDIFATLPETEIIEHRLMVPKDVRGEVVFVAEGGKHTIHDVMLKVEDVSGKTHELTMVQKWPIKTSRPSFKRLTIEKPLITGQRVIDTLFPIAKGGAAAIPGGFGTGKTMTQHQLAKWCDADIIVYVGCGERGNEMTQALDEFTELTDPKTGKSLMNRTVLIANTSNMPVAAREASIYTGVTIAEYYRDMGYHVALMADSTSRWAEALREISGRLEEMPAEEGFPAYLPSRLSQFYERAGYVNTLSGSEGSITIIGAVSPQGADFSEPVTQNTKRFIRCFCALSKDLAYSRHYPAVDWNESYSEYVGDLRSWFVEHVGMDFMEDRQRIKSLLAEENKLMEIVKLIGSDVLPADQKLVIQTAKLIRVGYLQQNAFHPDDTYVTLKKQKKMMEIILYLYDEAKKIVEEGYAFSLITKTGLFDRLTKMKYEVSNDELDKFDDYYDIIDDALKEIE